MLHPCCNIVCIDCQGTELTVIFAGSDIHCTSSYLGVTPVALTNADATANEATQGAPITGPGLAGPSPPSTHSPPATAPSLKSEAAQAPEQVSWLKQLQTSHCHACVMDKCQAFMPIARLQHNKLILSLCCFGQGQPQRILSQQLEYWLHLSPRLRASSYLPLVSPQILPNGSHLEI